MQLSLTLIIINSLAICGADVSMWQGNIFGPVRIWLNQRVPVKMIKKPLWDCVICMSSVWGFTFYYFTYGLHLWVVPHVLAVCALNCIFDSVVNYIRRHSPSNNKEQLL